MPKDECGIDDEETEIAGQSILPDDNNMDGVKGDIEVKIILVFFFLSIK